MREELKIRLLEIARESATAAVMGNPIMMFGEDDPELNARRGAFVTLKNRGRLRGCLGNFTSNDPLYQLVSRMAAASATEDPRFLWNPITSKEIRDINIEISVLSPLEKIDDPLDFELGKHGIYVINRGVSGCFLPQVAEETGWSKEEFLANCCEGKAGLSADAWKDPNTEVYVFTAEIFNEEDYL